MSPYQTWLISSCLALFHAEAILLSTSDRAAVLASSRHRSASDVFSRGCQPYPNKRVITTIVNGAFVDMFENWLHYAVPFLTSTEALHVFAEDESATVGLRNVQARSSVDFTIVDTYKNSRSLYGVDNVPAGSFNSPEYGQVVNTRPDRLLTLLSANCSVLYVDIDTVWMHNPFRDIATAGVHDMYLVDDSESNLKTHTSHPNLCACFLFMHPTPIILQFMREWSADMAGNRNQISFNYVLDKGVQPAKIVDRIFCKLAHSSPKSRESSARRCTQPVDFAILPFDKFPPGSRAQSYPNATVVHANYLAGHDQKISFLKEHGLWHSS